MSSSSKRVLIVRACSGDRVDNEDDGARSDGGGANSEDGNTNSEDGNTNGKGGDADGEGVDANGNIGHAKGDVNTQGSSAITADEGASGNTQSLANLMSNDENSMVSMIEGDVGRTLATGPGEEEPSTSPQSRPSWVEDAANHFHSVSCSDDWTSLVKKWLDMEANLGYPDGKVSA